MEFRSRQGRVAAAERFQSLLARVSGLAGADEEELKIEKKA